MERIEKLRRKKNAFIIAHNLQRPEVVEIADAVGGSTEIIRATVETSADIIVACGTDFMVEAVAVLNPDKKVLFPDRAAACPMAHQLSSADVREAKKQHPDAEVLLYMNSLAESQALADCICASENAIKIAETMDGGSPILFGPDRGLEHYINRRTSKETIPIINYGLCPMHHQIVPEDLIKAREAHPGAKIVGHPECSPEIQDLADYVGSTNSIVKYCKNAVEEEFLLASEVGLIHLIEKAAPDKKVYPVSTTAVCPQMKMITLAKIEAALENERPAVVIPREIAVNARVPLERMFELSRCSFCAGHLPITAPNVTMRERIEGYVPAQALCHA